MAKRRRRKAVKKGLGETISATLKQPQMSRQQVGIALAAMLAGSIAGAAAGKYSGLIGLGAIGIGAWRKNLNVASFGAGMFLTTAIKPTQTGTSGIDEEEMDGFDIKQFAQGAANRTKAYLQSLGEKLMLKKAESAQGTSGLNGNEVTYFVNPYNQPEQIDLSQLDKVQQQIAQMNGMGDIDPSERNF